MDLLAARRRKFDVDEYRRMGEAGTLHEDDRVEQIEGEIVEMSPIGSRHAACAKRLNALIGSQLAGRAIIGVQDPVLLPDYSGPSPTCRSFGHGMTFMRRLTPRPATC